jgi:hypothetical protein
MANSLLKGGGFHRDSPFVFNQRSRRDLPNFSMSEVLVQFDEPRCAPDGRSYIAQVCGRFATDGLWEAWIDFLPTDGGDTVCTPRETEQLSRGDLRYWAAGLTQAYLEEALDRALAPQNSRVTRMAAALASLDSLVDLDSLDGSEHIVLETNSLTRPVPVLDPFALYRQTGDYVLRQELRALDAHQLRDIIAAYEVPDIDTTDIARTFEDALAEQIVAGVQQSVGEIRSREGGNGVQSGR